MPYAEIAVFVTQEEYNDNGYAAQELCAKELRNRLSNTDMDYNVVEASDTPDMGTEDPRCDTGNHSEWQNMIDNCYVDPCTADSHLLITNWTFAIAGCGGGTAATVSYGPALANASSLDRYGTGTEYETFNVACQEIFHCFGVKHIHGENYWDDFKGMYLCTPMVTGWTDEKCDDSTACGQQIACNNPDEWDTQWCNCAENEAEEYLA